MQSKKKKTGRLSIGIIGAGAIAQSRHLPEFHSDSRADIVAIADPDTKRCKEMASTFRAKAYSGFAQMLADETLDAVVVAGPNAMHAQMTDDALAAGCHVLCEKPMAISCKDAQRMIATASRAHRKLMIAMNQRFMPQHERAKQIIDSGQLGRPLSFESTFAHGGPEQWSVDGAAGWFFGAKQAGFGALGDLGIHKIDLMRWLLGEDLQLQSAKLQTLHKQNEKGQAIDLDDNAWLLMQSKQGVVGTIRASWTHYGRQINSATVHCEGGTIEVGTDAMEQLIVHEKEGTRIGYRFADVNEDGWPHNSRVATRFLDCIVNETPEPVTGADGLACLQVVEAAIALNHT